MPVWASERVNHLEMVATNKFRIHIPTINVYDVLIAWDKYHCKYSTFTSVSAAFVFPSLICWVVCVAVVFLCFAWLCDYLLCQGDSIFVKRTPKGIFDLFAANQNSVNYIVYVDAPFRWTCLKMVYKEYLMRLRQSKHDEQQSIVSFWGKRNQWMDHHSNTIFQWFHLVIYSDLEKSDLCYSIPYLDYESLQSKLVGHVERAAVTLYVSSQY